MGIPKACQLDQYHNLEMLGHIRLGGGSVEISEQDECQSIAGIDTAVGDGGLACC